MYIPPPSSMADEIQIALFRQIVATTLSSRAEFYTNPQLQPWSGNGGDKINKKIKQFLKKVGAAIPGAEGVVDEEIGKVGRGSKGKTVTPCPAKEKEGAGGMGKKSKVDVKDEEEED